ncbi:MAG: purine-binding chemotaxis protein CheW [Planctomycetaceae bacterium]|nr:purine-binding chemotaxis protein CheW [Planctomycetaceae bacterium]
MSLAGASDTLTDLATDGNQYLTFMLQNEQFGIDILRVQEIKGYTRVTPIPNMPRFIKGAMNLRGTVVPIVDLRCKFSMPESDYNQFTVIIVVNVGTKILGLVVDAVSDVLNVSDDDIDATPDLGGSVDTSFIKGMAKSGEQLITLLDIEQLLNLEAVRAEAV